MVELRKLRKEQGYTQSDLAKKLNISRGYIAQIELKISKPSVKIAKQLGELFNFNWYELFE